MISDTGIVVDFSKPCGPLRAIHGVNTGPLCHDGALDNSAYFSEIGFATIRLHDCPYFYRGVVDVPCIFPLFHLDPADPSNYKFARTDGYIKAALDCGSRIVYRLGVSIQAHPTLKYDTDPPEDTDKWINICANIIRHYNDGWADGHHWNIRYWEIWNEPENGPNQWNGTFEAYIAFYIAVSRRLKAEFPDLLFGGPSLNGNMVHQARQKLDEFLPPLQKAGAPLDFLSWHVYPRRPGELVGPAQEVREKLDEYGFGAAESHLNEWNMGPPEHNWGALREPSARRRNFDEMHGAEGGALTAACLTVLQDVPVDMANYYQAAHITRGMFDDAGLPHKPFFAFRAFKTLLTESPIRYKVSGADPDNGLAILAGCSASGQYAHLLLTNHGAEQTDWRIALDGLAAPPTGVSSRVLDAQYDLAQEPIDRATLDGATLRVRIARNTVRLVRLELQAQH